jgi:hypothetical protein
MFLFSINGHQDFRGVKICRNVLQSYVYNIGDQLYVFCFLFICVYCVLQYCMRAVWLVKRCSFSVLIVLPLFWGMSIRIGGLKIIRFQNIKCYALVKILFANHIVTGHLKFLVFTMYLVVDS